MFGLFGNSGNHRNSSNRPDCTICRGRGIQNVWSNWPCDRCAGTGRSYKPGVGMNPAVPCSFCRGTGSTSGNRNVTCQSCGGSGKM